jgi:hypothetical protein
MKTAWVLGNGPGLPVDHLHLLDDEFTVGVNRIYRSGFAPKVVLWVDPMEKVLREEWPDMRQHMLENGSIGVSAYGHTRKNQCEYLLTLCNPKRNADKMRDPSYICCDGTSGIAAVRWCFALGFDTVRTLGISDGNHQHTERRHFFTQPGDKGGRNEHSPVQAEAYRNQWLDAVAAHKGKMVNAEKESPGNWPLDGGWTREAAAELLRRKVVSK